MPSSKRFSKRSSRKYDSFDSDPEATAAPAEPAAPAAPAAPADAMTRIADQLTLLKEIIQATDDGLAWTPFRVMELICMIVRVIKHLSIQFTLFLVSRPIFKTG